MAFERRSWCVYYIYIDYECAKHVDGSLQSQVALLVNFVSEDVLRARTLTHTTHPHPQTHTPTTERERDLGEKKEGLSANADMACSSTTSSTSNTSSKADYHQALRHTPMSPSDILQCGLKYVSRPHRSMSEGHLVVCRKAS